MSTLGPLKAAFPDYLRSFFFSEALTPCHAFSQGLILIGFSGLCQEQIPKWACKRATGPSRLWKR